MQEKNVLSCRGLYAGRLGMSLVGIIWETSAFIKWAVADHLSAESQLYCVVAMRRVVTLRFEPGTQSSNMYEDGSKQK